MKILFCGLLTIFAFGILGKTPTWANCQENTETSFHLSDEGDDDDCDTAEEHHCPWHFHYHHHNAFDEDLEDVAEELDEDTAWPGHREEYSDKLFR